MNEPTPETEAMAIHLHGTRLLPGCIYVTSDFARKLEIERNRAKSDKITSPQMNLLMDFHGQP